MRKSFEKALNETNEVHTPLPIDERDTAEYRLRNKPVLDSKLVCDMESLQNIKAATFGVSAAVATNYNSDALDGSTQLAEISLSDKIVHSGKHSLCFACPTNLPKLNDVAPGRIYAVPSAIIKVNRENWEKYNRLSVWVYGNAPGLKTITIRMQLHNDGKHKVPDPFNRDGAHNYTLNPNEWNHIVLEIPYLARDCVTGVGFEYDMVGHENDAADKVEFFIDSLEIQRVDCDVYSGWIPKNDRIIYSGSGYACGSSKRALACGIPAKTFRLIETETGRCVLEKEIETQKTRFGSFMVMDFSEVTDEGRYIIIAGDLSTRAFPIGNDVWEESNFKVLNFFLAERCGYDVKNKHRACHSDMLLLHDGMSIVENGGWHDAADVAQSLPNTNEGTAALLNLAIMLEGKGFERLRSRVIDEAKWGLDYVLKMRFGDGYRGTYSSASIWTDGIIGTHDDIKTNASDNAFVNFGAAYAETLGFKVFKESDYAFANYCKKIAEEDYFFAKEKWEKLNKLPERVYKKGGQPFTNSDICDTHICSMGALAAAELYSISLHNKYKSDAKEFSDILISCQQQEFTDWDVPMIGFFYQDRMRDVIWHHNHLSYSQFPDLALKAMCEVFPDDEGYIKWYNALTLSGEYYRALSKYSYPYGVIPAGVYHENEGCLGIKVMAGLSGDGSQEEEYKKMVREGYPLGKGYYVRIFPVWFSYRGNYNVLLSEAVAINASATYRNSYELYDIAQNQYKFIVGQNPFGQSTMVGEGYDFVQHYAVQPGQSAGSLTVGMQSLDEKDEPFWPQVTTATYKEVWICSATKWIWGMAGSFGGGTVRGVLSENGQITFVNLISGKKYTVKPNPHSGYYETVLPAGHYNVFTSSAQRKLTVVSTNEYTVNEDCKLITASMKISGENITVTINAYGDIVARFANVSDISGEYAIDGTLVLKGKLISLKKPVVGVLHKKGDLKERTELLDDRLINM